MTDIKQGYTRVTEVLYPFSGLKDINAEIVQNAADRGTRVHKVCESIVLGFGEWNVDEEIRPYVESFKMWWELGHNVVAVEERFYDDEFMLTGAVDLILRTEECDIILDLKTSYKPSKTWPLQGSAYAHMARHSGYNIQKIQFLHLNRDGGQPRIYEYPDQWDLYLHCWHVYNYFYRKRSNARKSVA